MHAEHADVSEWVAARDPTPKHLRVLRASTSFICVRFFPALPRYELATLIQAVPDRSLPRPSQACAQTGHSHSAEVLAHRPLMCGASIGAKITKVAHCITIKQWGRPAPLPRSSAQGAAFEFPRQANRFGTGHLLSDHPQNPGSTAERTAPNSGSNSHFGPTTLLNRHGRA